MLANREDLVGRATVLTDQPTHVTQPLATAERPERLLAEIQILRQLLRGRRGEGRHRGRLNFSELGGRGAQRVHYRHQAGDVTRLELALRLDETCVETIDDRNRR